MATDLLNAGMGDKGRLQFIMECLANQKQLYNTDEKYLIQKYQELETKIKILSGDKKKKSETLVSENDLNKIINNTISKENQTLYENKEKSSLKSDLQSHSGITKKNFFKGITVGLSVSLSIGFAVLFVLLYV